MCTNTSAPEEAIILTIAEYGLSGMRLEGYTGVWLEAVGEASPAQDLRYWRSSEPLGYDVRFRFLTLTRSFHFNHMVSRGLIDEDKGFLLMEELGREVSLTKAKTFFRDILLTCSGFEFYIPSGL